MHTHLSSLLLISLLASSSVHAAEAAPPAAQPVTIAASGPQNVLLVNPGDLFSGIITVEYERALSRWFGLSLGASLWAYRGPFAGQGEWFPSFGPELGLRLHVIRDAPGGLWIGPSVTFGYVAPGTAGDPVRPWAWGLGGALGYNFILFRHLVFQLGAGGGFTDYGRGYVWSPRLRLGLGAAF